MGFEIFFFFFLLFHELRSERECVCVKLDVYNSKDKRLDINTVQWLT